MGTILNPAATSSSRLQSLPYRLWTPREAVRGFVGLMIAWEQRLKDRETLRAMTAAQLRDIGLDAVTARQEADKPFWRA